MEPHSKSFPPQRCRQEEGQPGRRWVGDLLVVTLREMGSVTLMATKALPASEETARHCRKLCSRHFTHQQEKWPNP